MAIPNWTDMQFYQWLAIGGAVVLALSFGLYFGASSRGVKVPAIVVAAVGAMGAGVGIGVLLMGMLGYHWDKQNQPDTSPAAVSGGPPMPGGMPMGGMPMGGMPGMRGPSPKTQLSNLIAKMDLLTYQRPELTLTPAQRAKVRELIDKLDEKKELPDAEAQKQLDALLKILEGQRETLVAVGYRWPRQAGGRGGPAGGPRGGPAGGPPGGPPGGPGGGFGGMQRPPVANPFREDEKAREHLKSLREGLKKAG